MLHLQIQLHDHSLLFAFSCTGKMGSMGVDSQNGYYASQDPDDWLRGVSRQFSKQIMIPKLTKQCRPPPALFLTSAIVH